MRETLEFIASTNFDDADDRAIAIMAKFLVYRAKEALAQPAQKPVAWVSALEDALKEIAYAGMSSPFDMSDDGKTAWHAQQAWNFIGIASRGLAQRTEDTK